ncbi:MAG: anaerobic ribonucleoside-triphosphate reductase activating protein [Bacteroidales bacterium 45-6]|nr:MAG: anaerobic ribonucleoside-triphosphate reductase activating protein [Bacteroidales bacterium 45-6]
MNKLSVIEILHYTTVDGPGFRTVVYAAGCTHACPGCHNAHTWDSEKGKMLSVSEILETVRADDFANVTFSGGDPLFQVEGFTELARHLKAETDKNIWCYTGFTFEQVLRSVRFAQILPHIDVLVDGRFEESLKDENLLFRGSSNQRLVDVQASLAKGRVVLYENQLVESWM